MQSLSLRLKPAPVNAKMMVQVLCVILADSALLFFFFEIAVVRLTISVAVYSVECHNVVFLSHLHFSCSAFTGWLVLHGGNITRDVVYKSIHLIGRF